MKKSLCVFWVLLPMLLQACDRKGDTGDLPPDLPRFAIAGRDFRPWVAFLDPERASSGFNLILFERRVPVIVDLSGRTIHYWQDVRAVGRARLSNQGDLLVIGQDDSVSEYNWEGERTFGFQLENDGDMPHHDVRYLSNGNILVLAQTADLYSDYLLEVNRQGDVVWTWYANQGLQGWVEAEDLGKRDATHINSIQELPDNQWYTDGDGRFRPGNILISARNLNRLFIIERPSGRVVWDYRGNLDYQHEALIVPMGQVGQGLITVFNNRKHRPSFARMSQILAIHPPSNQTVWSYENEKFFSSLGGSQQPLPNGNILVTSTQGGRAFEVTNDGDIAWQWVPNVLPMRLVRYPRDHCPQLASVSQNPLPSIEEPRWQDFHDLELHLFGLPGERSRKTVNGEKINVLKEKTGCRQLWLPPDPELSVNFGLDSARLDTRKFQTRFLATVRPLPVGVSRVLVDETLDSDTDTPWRMHSVSLDDLALSRVELCVQIESAGPENQDWAVKMGLWQNPQVFTEAFRVRQALPPQTADEIDFQERQLKAIGYLQ